MMSCDKLRQVPRVRGERSALLSEQINCHVEQTTLESNLDDSNGVLSTFFSCARKFEMTASTFLVLMDMI